MLEKVGTPALRGSLSQDYNKQTEKGFQINVFLTAEHYAIIKNFVYF